MFGKEKIKKNEEINLPEVKGESEVSSVANIKSLDPKVAFNNYSPEQQKEISDLADKIDVTKLENVMDYGSIVFEKSFEQSGNLLKDERCSSADQEVIKQVIELSNKASKSYEDFNLVLKEPTFIQKFFLKMLAGNKGSRAEKIQNSAISNYKLIIELKKSCERWEKMLFDSMGQITNSYMSDTEQTDLLQKYIIAGYIAQERIENELSENKQKYEETGLIENKQKYDELKEGYDLFLNVMNNLEKARVMFILSMEELNSIKRSNVNVQKTIKTKKNETLAIMAQQLRNATLNAKNKEVIEGQQAISRLNNELIVEFAQTIGVTEKESEKLLYAGLYDTEYAKKAIEAVMNTCKEIGSMADQMLPKMRADSAELNRMVEELQEMSKGRNKIEDKKQLGTTSSSSSGLKY